jgi:hypothetical protein
MSKPLRDPGAIDALRDYDPPTASGAAFRRALETLDASATLRCS